MKKRNFAASWWRNIPAAIRKPLVLVAGTLFIIAAGLTGWLPGPGGIPLFLIGIAILATEFVWAEQLRDYLFDILKRFGGWIKQHPVIGGIGIVLMLMVFTGFAYLLYTHLYK